MIPGTTIVGLGLLRSPIRLKVQNGLLVSAEGDRAAEWLKKLGDTWEARNVAELGIGTNDKARLTGVILEDEKAWGTIHLAFGSNATFGGMVEAEVHLDAVIMGPTVYVDDKLLMQDGQLMVSNRHQSGIYVRTRSLQHRVLTFMRSFDCLIEAPKS